MTVLTSDALRCILNGDLNSRLENNGLICSSKEGLEFPFNLDGVPMNISGSIFLIAFILNLRHSQGIFLEVFI